jgi:hypothetical protein
MFPLFWSLITGPAEWLAPKCQLASHSVHPSPFTISKKEST